MKVERARTVAPKTSEATNSVSTLNSADTGKQQTSRAYGSEKFAGNDGNDGLLWLLLLLLCDFDLFFWFLSFFLDLPFPV